MIFIGYAYHSGRPEYMRKGPTAIRMHNHAGGKRTTKGKGKEKPF